MKLHVGCGTVFLTDGFINIDLPSASCFLSSERPDLVEKYSTTSKDYYGRHKDKNITTLRKGACNKETVCDRFGTAFALPCRDSEADEIICRQVLEHLSTTEAKLALKEFFRTLIPGGLVRISVPDHEGTMNKFLETGDKFFIRHLLGPRIGPVGYHLISYRRYEIIELVESCGFSYYQDDFGIHDYPAHSLVFIKRQHRLYESGFNRFYEQVKKIDDGCWEWIGLINDQGYGRFQYYREKYLRVKAHRYSYEVHRGPIPEGFVVDHKCSNRKCVNPEHLDAVTQLDNVKRTIARGRNINKSKTRCSRGHEFNAENTYKYRDGRQCRICAKMTKRMRCQRDKK